MFFYIFYDIIYYKYKKEKKWDKDIKFLSKLRGTKIRPENVLGWASQEIADKVKKYTRDLETRWRKEDVEVDIIDLGEDMGIGFYAGYPDSILSKEVFYRDILVPIVSFRGEDMDRFGEIKILWEGEEKIVKTKDCKLKYNIDEKVYCV